MARTLKSIEYIKDKVGKIFIMSNSITHNETSLEDILNRPKLYMVSGSVTKTINSDAVQMHTWMEIQTLFKNAYGFTPTNYLVLGVSYANGDGGAAQAHVDGATFLDNIFHAVLDRQHSGTIRINYAYFYNN